MYVLEYMNVSSQHLKQLKECESINDIGMETFTQTFVDSLHSMLEIGGLDCRFITLVYISRGH